MALMVKYPSPSARHPMTYTATVVHKKDGEVVMAIFGATLVECCKRILLLESAIPSLERETDYRWRLVDDLKFQH